MNKGYEELSKRASELERKLSLTSPRKEEIKIVYGKVSDEFFKTENWAWVAGFFQGDGYSGYIESWKKDGRYYPIAGITQDKSGIKALEVLARLWLTRSTKHGRNVISVRKTGKVVCDTILPTLLPRLYTPKKEEAEFVIEHGSPVTAKVKEEFLRTFVRAKGRKSDQKLS